MKVNNLVDESDWTDAVTARTGIVPTRPGILTFDSTTRTTIYASFTALTGADTGGTDEQPLEVTYYHVYIDSGSLSTAEHMLNDDHSNFKLLTSLPGSQTSFTASYLVPHLTYRFKVQAENSALTQSRLRPSCFATTTKIRLDHEVQTIQRKNDG